MAQAAGHHALVSDQAPPATAPRPRSFEEALRDLVHDSPYLVVSVLVHGLLLLLFATAPAAPRADPRQILHAEAPAPAEVLPPPPPPAEQLVEAEPPLVEVPSIVEEPPLVADSALSDSTSADLLPPGAGGESAGSDNVLGVGKGGLPPGSGFGDGKLNRRGTGGQPFSGGIEDALVWLARHQSSDGHWSCGAFDEECGKLGDDVLCDGAGSPQFDVGVTSLSLLAFLGAGNTDKRGRHARTVGLGLRYLVNVQQENGDFGSPTAGQSTYDHVLATLALVEAYALSGREYRFRGPAEKGLARLAELRNPGGAWRYRAFHPEMTTTPNDMSVTGWAILTLTLARDYGLRIDEQALADARLFLDELTDPQTGVTGYDVRGGRPAREAGRSGAWPAEQSESMTAVAVLCRIFADPKLTAPGEREIVERGIARIAALPPVWDDALPGRRDYYFWYYGSYALYQYGGAPWKAWEQHLLPAIAEHQHRQGERRGSWDPQPDPWGSAGGRVYSTAILALTLEVFSRYSNVMGAH